MTDRRRLATFYLIAVAITVVVMASRAMPGAPDVVPGLLAFLRERRLTANLVSIIRYALEQPWAWLICVFAAAPTLAALLLTALEGRGAIRRLLGRLRPWAGVEHRRSAIRFYAAALMVTTIVMATYYWLGSRQGTPDQLAFRDQSLGSTALPIVLILLGSHLVDEGGALEELGWRGYALPILLTRYTPVVASVVLGVLWMAWHLPREVPSLLAGRPLGPFVAGQAVFLLLTIALSILCTYGYLVTGGSVVPAVLIHGGTNVWSKALGGALSPDLLFGFDPRTAVVVLLAIVVLVVSGRVMRPSPTSSPHDQLQPAV